MNKVFSWIVDWGMLLGIALCFVASVMAFRRVVYGTFEGPAYTLSGADRDPAYQNFQKYRYTYGLYGYLFLSSEEQEHVQDKTSDSASLSNQENKNNEAGLASVSAQEIARYADYDYLMKEFYVVHPSTTAPREMMRAENFFREDLHLEQNPEVPQILIYHTHSQETYADYANGNMDACVTAVGERLAGLLRERGWNVIHDTAAYDMQGGKLDRNRAYTYALDGITRILQEYPTIEVILDVHRDGVGENTRLVSHVDGRTTANIMFFQGMSRTPEGSIEYLPNPYLEDNLAFSFQMQYLLSRGYPGFTRKIYMKGLRYNLHLRPRSALVEVGAQTNTGEEALNAMFPLSEVLDKVLQGK